MRSKKSDCVDKVRPGNKPYALLFFKGTHSTNYFWRKLHTFFLGTMEEKFLWSRLLLVFTWWIPFYSCDELLVFTRKSKWITNMDNFFPIYKECGYIALLYILNYFLTKKTELCYAHMTKEKMMNHSLIKYLDRDRKRLWIR